MNAIAVHRNALQWAAELFTMTTAGITPEQAGWLPPGTANPLKAICAHAICALDVITNALMAGGAPLYASTWEGRSGVSEPQMQAEFEWGRRLEVDLPSLQRYAEAVFESADAYIAGLDEQDLQRELDLTGVGLGVRTLDWCLSALVVGHLQNMTGEISCLKGLQGGQGYPF